MRREELRTELLSLLYTQFLFKEKEIWFKARYLASDMMNHSSQEIGRMCSFLQDDGLLIRHGSRNPSKWGTRFNSFNDPTKKNINNNHSED